MATVAAPAPATAGPAGPAAALRALPPHGGQPGEPSPATFPPIEFFYSHLHDSIRGELATLAADVQRLEGAEDLGEQLWHLRERYRFLGQVYKYHSSVEDEVGDG